MANHEGPMACPVDGSTLVMSERSGIEIDYCPTCRGVWLDRGELDKIIERNNASQTLQQPASPPPQQQVHHPQSGLWGAPPPQYGHGHGHKPYKRRKSFLEDLFD
jgi:uncharacterized protein